jgi:peroxiredoxin Q/BCP
MSRLKVGDSLPPLTLTTHNGEQLSLKELHKPIVLFFYPKDGSPICTRQACAFRDAYEDFVQAGAVVIGISGDSSENHELFAKAHHLPFLLVSDPEGKIRQAIGVPKTLGLFPGRVTYVADGQGVIRHLFSSQMDAERHVTEALQILHSLDDN